MLLIKELGDVIPAQLPRADNKSITLPLFSRWEMDVKGIPLIKEEPVTSSREDLLYNETKSCFMFLLQALNISPNEGLQNILDSASQSNQTHLILKSRTTTDLLIRVIQSIPNIEQGLLHDIEKEYQEQEHIKSSLNEELNQLEIVYSAIQTHNQFLNSQIEVYKEYLVNVRGKSVAQGIKKKNSKFTHAYFVKEGVVVKSSMLADKISNCFYTLVSNSPASFLLSLFFKGMTGLIHILI